jgi:hypothetical protein
MFIFVTRRHMACFVLALHIFTETEVQVKLTIKWGL